MRSGIGAWVAVLCLVVQTPCFADQEASASVPPTITPPAAAEATGSSSSSSASYFKGLADSKSNLIAARYKERLNNFRSQIENAISKGWLTADESEMFRNQVVALTYLENEVSQKGYPKEDLDDLEQRFNEFNRRLSQTMVKGTPKPPPVTTDSVSAPVAVQNQPQPGDVGATTLPATKPAPAPVKKPAAKKPAAQKPAAKKPAAKKPAAKKPAVKKPAAKKPAAKKPAAKKPAVKKPAAKKPAVKKPAAKKPAAKKPAAKKPAA